MSPAQQHSVFPGVSTSIILPGSTAGLGETGTATLLYRRGSQSWPPFLGHSGSQADQGRGPWSPTLPPDGVSFHLNKKELCQGPPTGSLGWTGRLSGQGGEQGLQGPLTWMGFSMSPSHRDTNGTVNGFHTGSSVYLITCRTVRGKGDLRPSLGSSALGSGQPSGDREWQDGETHGPTSEDRSVHPCGRGKWVL